MTEHCTHRVRFFCLYFFYCIIYSGLAKTGRLIVLFEVTNEYAEAISTKLWYSNIQLTVLHVLTNLLLFHQRCPQAFHRALPHLVCSSFYQRHVTVQECMVTQLIKFDAFCLNWSCSTSTDSAA